MCYENRKSYVVVQNIKSVMNNDDTLRKCPQNVEEK